MQTNQKEQIDRLRREILCLQGLGTKPGSESPNLKLGSLLKSMPGQVFPTGAIHEFLSSTLAESAATTGFIAALLNTLIQNNKPCVWVSRQRKVFPPALMAFNINPNQIIFIDAIEEKEALWVIEEALKCKSVGAVIGEIRELNFMQSRRLQLAVENSRVTGFINRLYPYKIQPTACIARWQIRPVNSQTPTGLPGIGFPKWQVELLKIRNGKPGRWRLEWTKNAFHIEDNPIHEISWPAIKTVSA